MTTRAELARELSDTSEAKQAMCRKLVAWLEAAIKVVEGLAAGEEGAARSLDKLCRHPRYYSATLSVQVDEALMLECERLDLICQIEEIDAATEQSP